MQSVINFLSIALALFLCIKAINKTKNKLHSKKKTAEVAEVEEKIELTKSEALLAEIRDLLKSQRNDH